ncbi:MAG: hypothetical protein DMF89_04980 [Acidobacteria bacterium]|nr:MAG: hypothetical protein DMF89_04980 [Acidobacteriota bacterium]
MRNDKDVVIVGAGPYGLSAVAHLLAAGVEPYVIGKPLAFWKHNMPRGMLLRSGIEASNIDAPQGRLSLRGYLKRTGRRLVEPLPLEDFVAYGDWFQTQVAPALDTREVRGISHDGRTFELSLDDGEILGAESIILALGIGRFCQRPDQFEGVPRELAFHSSDLSDPSQFKGQRVAVIGRGQSALECAALLHENQAEVVILTRSPVRYFGYKWKKHLFRALTPGPLRPFSYRVLPPTDLGGFRNGRKMAHPDKFRREFPESQKALLKLAATPIGAYWLMPRLANVTVKAGVTVSCVEQLKNGLKLTLSSGAVETVDRVVLATGYKVDISKLGILDESLTRNLKVSDGYPVLTTGLETSVKGLYLAGVVAEKTLGPTMRFVTGTSNAGPRLAAAIVGERAVKRLTKRYRVTSLSRLYHRIQSGQIRF